MWMKQRRVSLLVTILFVLPTLGFVLGSVALTAYIFWPVSLSGMAMPAVNPHARHVFLIAHGVRDSPASWAAPLKRIFEQELAGEGDTVQVVALDWAPYSDTALRCSVNGKRIGEVIGKKLAASVQLQSVHLVAHSCGSFVILGVCDALKKKRNTVQVHSTYLAPVSIYGGLFWNYGIAHFGQCADFSEAYIDREDSVPGSNQLLPNTHTFDVSTVRNISLHSQLPHLWPTYYYQRLVRSGSYPALRNHSDLSQRYPRGVLSLVTDAEGE